MPRTDDERRIAARFAGLDQDGNGHIDRQDFCAAARALLAEFAVTARSDRGQALFTGADALWQGMAGIADGDGDQRITRQEFERSALKRLRDHPEGFAALARPFLHAALAVAGADADGTVTAGDVARALRALGVPPDTADTAAASLAAAQGRRTGGRVDEETIVTAFAHWFTVPDREERADRGERADRADRRDLADRAESVDRPGRAGLVEAAGSGAV